MRAIWLLAAAAAACAPAAREEVVPRNEAAPPAAAPSRPSAYLVRGEPRANWSPGWAAVIRDGRLLLDSPTSAGWYAMVLPAARREGGSRVYAAERLRLTVRPGACGLREYYPALPDAVTLDWDSGRFEGCGGAQQPSSEIAGTVWELVRIGDDRAPATRSPAATFVFGENGGVGGTLNCNDGGISATWTASGGFVAGREPGFMQTAIGCFDAGETFGRRFWNAMPTARAWRRDGERLFITFADGSEAELLYLL